VNNHLSRIIFSLLLSEFSFHNRRKLWLQYPTFQLLCRYGRLATSTLIVLGGNSHVWMCECILFGYFSKFNNRLPGVAFYRLIRNCRSNASVLGSHLQSRDSSLSSVRYYRLMAVSLILGIWDVCWISTGFRLAILGSGPLPSWKTIHSSDSQVVIPDRTPESIALHLALWWSIPGSAYLYFLLFGASREVLSDYQKFWVWFRIRVLRQTVPLESVSTTKYVLPFQILREIFSILTALFSLDLPVIVCPRISRPLPSINAGS
jgi:hypothetical protein